MASYDEYALRGMLEALKELDARRKNLISEMEALSQRSGIALDDLTLSAGSGEKGSNDRKKRKGSLSPEGRQRLAEAQRARWAARRAKQQEQ